MYGIVNQAIVAFMERRLGTAGAQEAREAAGFTSDFLSMDQYPDEMSVGLVAATSERLGIDAAKVLEEIGEYWVEFARASAFGDQLTLSANSFREALEGLDDMHVRMSHDFAGYEPPSFRVEAIDASKLRLHYRSVRNGLAPLASGIVQGLAKLFDEEVDVELVSTPSESEAVLEVSGIGLRELGKAS